jgi:hypothetical protein
MSAQEFAERGRLRGRGRGRGRSRFRGRSRSRGKRVLHPLYWRPKRRAGKHLVVVAWPGCRTQTSSHGWPPGREVTRREPLRSSAGRTQGATSVGKFRHHESVSLFTVERGRIIIVHVPETWATESGARPRMALPQGRTSDGV